MEFKLEFLFMVISIVVLGIQIWNIKMRALRLIIKSDARKVMANSGFGCRFHDLAYFEVGRFFVFLEFFINLRASL